MQASRGGDRQCGGFCPLRLTQSVRGPMTTENYCGGQMTYCDHVTQGPSRPSSFNYKNCVKQAQRVCLPRGRPGQAGKVIRKINDCIEGLSELGQDDLCVWCAVERDVWPWATGPEVNRMYPMVHQAGLDKISRHEKTELHCAAPTHRCGAWSPGAARSQIKGRSLARVNGLANSPRRLELSNYQTWQ